MKVETRPPAPPPAVGTRRTALAGALAAAVALAASTFVDAVSGPVPSLVAVVGQAVIRHTPGFLSRGATETVGTADKPLLLAMIVVLAIGIGTRVAGAARRRPRAGDVAFAAFGLLAVVCAASLHHVSLGATLAGATVAAGAGAVTLRRLLAAAAGRAGGSQRPCGGHRRARGRHRARRGCRARGPRRAGGRHGPRRGR